MPLPNVPEFFARDLLDLRLVAEPHLTPAAARVTVLEELPTPRFSLDAEVRGWLDFDVEFGPAGAAVSLRDAVAAVARGESYVQAGPETFLRLDPKSVAKRNGWSNRLGATATVTGYRLPARQIGGLQEVVAKLGGVEAVTAAYRQFLDELRGLTLDEAASLPPAVEQTLREQGFVPRPYQRQGVQWLRWLAANGLHGLLADDMGLGKTAQTLLAIRADYEEHPTDPPHGLVVCPNAVVENWAREAARLFPAITIDRHLGDARALVDFQAGAPRLFISSYATMAREPPRCATSPCATWSSTRPATSRIPRRSGRRR